MADAAVAVVIPLHNKARSVGAAIGSVLAQSFERFEVVVIDDGSTDDGAAKVSLVHDPRLRLLKQANAGVSAARNAGVRASSAPWIAFLDADDAWASDHLASLMESAADGRAVAVFSNLDLASRPSAPSVDPARVPQAVPNYFAFALANGGYPASASSIMVSRAALHRAGGFPEGRALGEDVDTWCRLALLGPFRYTGLRTASYDDAVAAGSAYHQTKPPEPPLFPDTLRRLEEQGLVPAHLTRDARRYANFLDLEHARQLIDRGRFAEARAVLLRRCTLSFDPARFLRRLTRTFPPGRLAYRLGRALSSRWSHLAARTFGADPH